MEFVSIHKKESKNPVKIYGPIRLFPIFSKILERLTFCSLFTQNSFFTECQSGFIRGEYKNLVLSFVQRRTFKLFCLSHFQYLDFNPYQLRILPFGKVKLTEAMVKSSRTPKWELHPISYPVNFVKHNLVTSLFPTLRSSRQRCSVKKGVLKNLAKFTGKHLCQSLFLDKTTGLRSAKSFAKILRTAFLRNTLNNSLFSNSDKPLFCFRNFPHAKIQEISTLCFCLNNKINRQVRDKTKLY